MHGERNLTIRTRELVLISVAAGLSVALSFLRLFSMPQGGSVTLEAIPLLYVAFRFGTGAAMAAGAVSGIVQLLLRPIIVHPVQVVLDYPLAMAACGVAGVFRTVNSDRSVRVGLTVFLGVVVVFVAGLQWFELRRVSRTDEIEVQRSPDSRIVMWASADTILGGLQTKIVTYRNSAAGRSSVVGVTTAHGETARDWLDYGLSVVRAKQYEWLGNFLLLAAALAGIALVAARLPLTSVALGVSLASFLKWGIHVVSGAVFFSAYAPLGESAWIYSAAYNAAYAIPQLLLALLLLPPLLRRGANNAGTADPGN